MSNENDPPPRPLHPPKKPELRPNPALEALRKRSHDVNENHMQAQIGTAPDRHFFLSFPIDPLPNDEELLKLVGWIVVNFAQGDRKKLQEQMDDPTPKLEIARTMPTEPPVQ